MTYQQDCKAKRIKRVKKNRTSALRGNPFVKGRVISIHVLSPARPNSAKRTCCKVSIKQSAQQIYAYIPGEGNHGLEPYSEVLIRGGRTKDTRGLYYKVVRGKYDCKAVLNRKTSRSKYGTKK